MLRQVRPDRCESASSGALYPSVTPAAGSSRSDQSLRVTLNYLAHDPLKRPTVAWNACCRWIVGLRPEQKPDSLAYDIGTHEGMKVEAGT